MPRSLEGWSAWASLLGTVATILGLLQSASWLMVVGVGLLGVSLFALSEARRSRRAVRFATLHIEGQSVDSLNLANLRRRLNRSLMVQKAYHRATIHGADLAVTWQYDGYARVEQATNMEFSIDADRHIPFADLDCLAYDLRLDPDCQHAIRPVLVGHDGLCKKVAIPFLAPLHSQDPFSLLLQCHLPGCLAPGVQYYTSSLSFRQELIGKLAVHLVFVGVRPDWVRLYEPDDLGQPTLLKDLRPCAQDDAGCEYLDIAERVPGQSTRIYVFHRPAPSLNGLDPRQKRSTQGSSRIRMAATGAVAR